MGLLDELRKANQEAPTKLTEEEKKRSEKARKDFTEAVQRAIDEAFEVAKRAAEYGKREEIIYRESRNFYKEGWPHHQLWSGGSSITKEKMFEVYPIIKRLFVYYEKLGLKPEALWWDVRDKDSEDYRSSEHYLSYVGVKIHW